MRKQKKHRSALELISATNDSLPLVTSYIWTYTVFIVTHVDAPSVHLYKQKFLPQARK